MTDLKEEIYELITNNKKSESSAVLQSERNLVTSHVLRNGDQIVIKSFKSPSFFNKIIYKYFRKSKAQRSFEYASHLIKNGIKTPKPILYKEFFDGLGLNRSFYVSELILAELTYRELTTDFSIPDYEKILRAFTRFTLDLHNKGILFLDHSPGNTLITRNEDGYDFYLVDLNRMKFGSIGFKERIKNFAKLTIHKSMVKTMSNEYAKYIDQGENEVFDLMWKYTQEFQNRYHKKRRLKRILFFWKKKYR